MQSQIKVEICVELFLKLEFKLDNNVKKIIKYLNEETKHIEKNSIVNVLIECVPLDRQLWITYKVGNCLHGECKFLSKHKVYKTIPYENGKKHGIEYEYYKSGHIARETSYNMDVKHGKYAKYYNPRESTSKHRIDETAYYVFGEIHGEYVGYYRNGNLYLTVQYDNGKMLGQWRSFHSNGAIWVTKYYANEATRGPFEERDQSGNIIKSLPSVLY